jgi:hypothetical protein
VFGTFIALVPNLVRVPVARRQEDSVPVARPSLHPPAVLAKVPHA